jgi:hypothetical protein
MYGVLLYVSSIVPLQMSVITIYHCHTSSWTAVLLLEQFFYVLIHIKNPTRCNSVSKFISYLYEAQHVLGDTPPIIRSLKLHWQPLVLHAWKVVWLLDADRVQQLHVQQLSTHAKPEAASAVLGS